MNTISHLRQLIMLAVVALALLPHAPVSAQEDDSLKAFAPVDEAHRAPLTDLLNRLVEYERTQQWEKLYDIISAEFRRGKGKDDFVWEMLSSADERFFILDFAPKLTYVNDPPNGRYTFAGCGNVFGKGRRQAADIYITVISEGGLWRISEASMLASCGVPPELKCTEGE